MECKAQCSDGVKPECNYL